ncbi:MAG: hypothetical protein ABI177_05625 [Edaphobacter sp.]
MLVPLHALTAKVGKGTPAANLAIAVAGLMRFHQRVMVMVCSLFGEPELRERFRSSLGEGGRGPERGIATIASYIEAEKVLGRIGADVDANGAARVLMSSSFFHVFTAELFGGSRRLDVKGLVRLAIRES